MHSKFKRQTNSKVIIYVVIAVILLGICAVVMQEIKVPTEHITEVIDIDLGK